MSPQRRNVTFKVESLFVPDHELMIAAVNRVSDGIVLKLIKKFLKAGVMKDGAKQQRRAVRKGDYAKQQVKVLKIVLNYKERMDQRYKNY